MAMLFIATALMVLSASVSQVPSASAQTTYTIPITYAPYLSLYGSYGYGLGGYGYGSSYYGYCGYLGSCGYPYNGYSGYGYSNPYVYSTYGTPGSVSVSLTYCTRPGGGIVWVAAGQSTAGLLC